MEMTMSSAVAEIEAKVRTLSREDKAELIRALIAELDGPPTPMSSVPGSKKRSDATARSSKGR